MKNKDNSVKKQKIYKECKIEFVDNLETKYEVKGMVFQPNRMKKKEQLRKLTEEYIDR